MKWLIALLTISLCQSVLANNLTSDLDALGGNQALMRKAEAIDPSNRIRIVQHRLVNRHNRIELGLNYGLTEGGDPYMNIKNWGAQLEYHFNPHWSIGARYYNFSNTLSSEGERVFSEANARAAAGQVGVQVPATDVASNSYMGTISWYPFYGKLSLFNTAIAQFDLYVLGGYGQINLASGSTETYTGGGGIALWLSQHFSSRLEIRYQGYKDQIYSGARQIDLCVFTAGIGVLL